VRHVLPRPVTSLLIAGFWLVLVNRISVGHALLAVLLGVALPLITARFALVWPRIHRAGTALELAALFVYDLLVANVVVAAYVLGLRGPIRPAFVEVPLDSASDDVATLLAGMVTLTPGTVSVDIDSARRVLLVHALVSEDPARTAGEIKARYESRLKEIFGC
jgi:multicomponent K+:H+ antiporter subunit E